MKNLSIIFLALFFAGCASKQKENTTSKENNAPAPGTESMIFGPDPYSGIIEAAYFAEGCFWHADVTFQSVKGVLNAIPGYAGGDFPNPNYQDVCSGKTGHAETVMLMYKPDQVSFETLVRVFFASHDPTQLNRQGNDVGAQYRSIAFYKTPEEKAIIEKVLNELNASKKYSSPVVTEVKEKKDFWSAEDYHDEYVKKHPENPYVQSVVMPEYIKFRKEFRGAALK